jgi:hypothetical protein
VPDIHLTFTFRGGKGSANVSVFARSNNSLVATLEVKRSGSYPLTLKKGRYALALDGIAPQQGMMEFTLNIETDPETPETFEGGGFASTYSFTL